MSEDQILYDALVLDALRGVVRAVLNRVQKRGVPGDHHFYVTFDTQAPGVNISKRLKDQYPQEMTIVLQHQFWDLYVFDDRFEVRLSFNTIPERLVVPFDAIRVFADPSVDFAMGLRSVMPEKPAPMEEAAVPPKGLPAPVESLPPTALPKPLEAVGAGEDKPQAPAAEEQGTERKSAEVVSLDKFRKK